MDIKKHILKTPGYLEELASLDVEPLPQPRIVSAKIKLLWQCNLACSFCQLPPAGPPMTVAQVEDVLQALKSMGAGKVHFSGGEIFLHPDILKILALTVQAGFQVNLTTNGTLLDKELVRSLARIKVHSISLSIDGSAAQKHDQLRGQSGAFKSTLKALQRLVQLYPKGPKVRVNTVVSRENIHDLSALHERLLGISEQIRWRLILIHSQDPKLLLSKTLVKELLKQSEGWPLLENYWLMRGLTSSQCAYIAQGHYGLGCQATPYCYMPWMHVFIDPVGYVYPCCRSRGQIASLGNVFQESLHAILTGPRCQAIRMGMAAGQPLDICHDCDDFAQDNQRICELISDEVK